MGTTDNFVELFEWGTLTSLGIIAIIIVGSNDLVGVIYIELLQPLPYNLPSTIALSRVHLTSNTT